MKSKTYKRKLKCKQTLTTSWRNPNPLHLLPQCNPSLDSTPDSARPDPTHTFTVSNHPTARRPPFPPLAFPTLVGQQSPTQDPILSSTCTFLGGAATACQPFPSPTLHPLDPLTTTLARLAEQPWIALSPCLASFNKWSREKKKRERERDKEKKRRRGWRRGIECGETNGGDGDPTAHSGSLDDSDNEGCGTN